MDVKFKFDDIGKGPFGKVMRPVAKVTMRSPFINKNVTVWMIVDTGADFTILPRHLSQILRISLENDCIKEATFGVGGERVVYLCKPRIEASIGTLKRSVPVGFIDSNEVPPLMGRQGFLETFDTSFLKSHVVVFK